MGDEASTSPAAAAALSAAAEAPAPATAEAATPQPPQPAATTPHETSSPAEGPWTREAAIARDREDLKDVIHAHHLKTFTEDFAKLVCHKTAYRRLMLHVQFSDNYPSDPLHVEVQSDTLPAKLVEKLQAMFREKLEKPADQDGLGVRGRPHVAAFYAYVDEMIHENKLLWATPEVRQTLALAKEIPDLTIAVNDEAGTLKLKATCGKYMMRAVVTVPDEYPASPLEVEMKKCSFPPTVHTVFLLQAREIARKCSIGVSVERAVQQSTTVVADRLIAPPQKPGTKRDVKMTSAHLKDIKHDVNFLKKANDLQEVNASYNKQLHMYLHSTQVRRAARRELRKLTKQEFEKERAREEAEAAVAEEEQLREWRRVTGQEDLGPQRCIRAVVEFLTRGFIFRLPKEKSLVSDKAVFPADPAKAQELINRRRKDRPTRVPSCGCWWIYSELKIFMETPPFPKPCPRPACNGAIVEHPEFENDPKKRELAYSKSQAVKREMQEVEDFLGM
ncbi:Hypothetical Protein FCC1311_045392 [Hondaea fermentalgiana]|uniref:RWD domain-containing protein n=1 Tax=Hondaea fermentalgiana TaxID=2315210 RepID=A0A2R5GBD8_9STRA|nr:Hypothetical Protein FCC1311_045392 [Hondaea fermentalgiana]|eukprot:GBG28316.1 Hypothetical Protein FCC1311_045392 [Hondaea fermentalgiana]